MPEATEMQMMEMEMVQGMYDTFEMVSNDPPSYCVLLAASDDTPPELKVTVVYPNEEYPEAAACEITIESIAKSRRIQVATISKDIAQVCEENVGMHTVIMALQQTQEFLSNSAAEEEKAELVRKGVAMEAAAVARGAVVADPTIRLGTAVTRELFDEWSKRHRTERVRAREEREKREARAVASKLSGKQLWDNTIKSTDWELFGEAEDGGEDVDFEAFDTMDEDNFDLGSGDDDDGN